LRDNGVKVLFISLGVYGRIGGIERFNQRVISCLQSANPSVISDCAVISLWDKSEPGKSIKSHNFAFVPGSSNKIATLLSFLYHGLRLKPDLFLYGHVMLGFLSPIARLLRPKAHHVLIVYGAEVWNDPTFRKIPHWERFLVRSNMDTVISISHFTQVLMKKVYRMNHRSFHLLPCAIDLDNPSSGRSQKLSSLQGRHRLLTVSRLTLNDRYKGCDKVIRSLMKILPFFPDTHYFIVGKGPLKEELRALARNLGISDHVHFLGYLSDDELNHVYHQCHVFVMPSTMEGFGIVFLEAWKHMLPVVAGDRDASTEVITHAVDGLLVNPDSIRQLSEAIMRLLENPDLASAMGHNGFKKVMRFHSHDVFKQRFLDILQKASK
jgi:phosphatidyl-myo-inositol dimannoside synthase